MPSALSVTANRALRRAAPLWLVAALAVLVAALTLPAFRTPVSVGSLLMSLAPVVLVSVGQGLVVLSGGIDLSVGAVAGLATVVLSLGAVLPGGAGGAVVAAVVAGLVVGLINGLGVTAGINPLLMTFALAGVIQGVALLLQTLPSAATPSGTVRAMATSFGPVPLTAVVALVLVVAAWWWVSQTRVGRILLGAGYDPRTARRLGLPVVRTSLLVYALSGTFAALGGLAIVTRTYTADALVGSSSVIDSVATVLVAGILITGGVGSLLNVLPAAVLIAVMGQVIVLTGTDAYYQSIFKGVLLVAALGVYRLAGHRISIPWRLRRPALVVGGNK